MQALTFFFAFLAVLALIGLAAWLVRRFGARPRRVGPFCAAEVRRAAPEFWERRRARGDPRAGFTPGPLGGRPEPRPELRGDPIPSRVTSRNAPVIPRPPRPSEAPKAPPV